MQIDLGYFPVSHFDFFWNSWKESLFKIIFHVVNCNKRVSVNKWTNFQNIYNMKNAVWTHFDQLYFAILRGGWETGKEYQFEIKISQK